MCIENSCVWTNYSKKERLERHKQNLLWNESGARHWHFTFIDLLYYSHSCRAATAQCTTPSIHLNVRTAARLCPTSRRSVCSVPPAGAASNPQSVANSFMSCARGGTRRSFNSNTTTTIFFRYYWLGRTASISKIYATIRLVSLLRDSTLFRSSKFDF